MHSPVTGRQNPDLKDRGMILEKVCDPKEIKALGWPLNQSRVRAERYTDRHYVEMQSLARDRRRKLRAIFKTWVPENKPKPRKEKHEEKQNQTNVIRQDNHDRTQRSD